MQDIKLFLVMITMMIITLAGRGVVKHYETPKPGKVIQVQIVQVNK